MKKVAILFSVMMIGSFIIIYSCKKNDNSNPDPSAKKKCAWVVGDADSTGYGMILYSPDGGDTWERQGMGSAALDSIDLMDVWALDENNVWAVGSKNAILHTTDGGKTWMRIDSPVNPSNPILQSLSIINNTNLWISGSKGTVYNSTDGGNTWAMFDTNFFQGGLMQGIWAHTPDVIYVVGDVSDQPGANRGFISKTLNGGNTWDIITPVNDYNKWQWIGVTSYGNTVVVYGRKSHYVFSIDGGITWKNDSIADTGGIGGADINHLIMLDSQIWWGAFDLGNIYITEDGGSNWIKQLTPSLGGEFLVGIDAWDRQLALAVGESDGWPLGGSILKTSDGGDIWELKDSQKVQLSKVSFIR